MTAVGTDATARHVVVTVTAETDAMTDAMTDVTTAETDVTIDAMTVGTDAIKCFLYRELLWQLLCNVTLYLSSISFSLPLHIPLSFYTYYPRKDGAQMSDKKSTNVYDDGNIPDIDLPQNNAKNSNKSAYEVEPLPEASRPRKDGPGGD